MTDQKQKIQLRGVKKAFGNNKVLQGVDLDVPEGKSLVVIGGSGTGKSVMLKSIIGLVVPDEGSIMIDGEETTGLSAKGRDTLMQKFGMLFQSAALFDSMKVWENVAFGLIQGRGMDRQEAYSVAIEKMSAVGLNEAVGHLFPAELSGGMQKRVGLARAIAANPEIVFFDEPTTGLDPIMADVINELIVETVDGLGATTLSITHDMASARKIADYVAMIYHGKIIWHGPVDDLDHSGNEYVDQFIHGRAEGRSQMTYWKVPAKRPDGSFFNGASFFGRAKDRHRPAVHIHHKSRAGNGNPTIRREAAGARDRGSGRRLSSHIQECPCFLAPVRGGLYNRGAPDCAPDRALDNQTACPYLFPVRLLFPEQYQWPYRADVRLFPAATAACSDHLHTSAGWLLQYRFPAWRLARPWCAGRPLEQKRNRSFHGNFALRARLLPLANGGAINGRRGGISRF